MPFESPPEVGFLSVAGVALYIGAVSGDYGSELVFLGFCLVTQQHSTMEGRIGAMRHGSRFCPGCVRLSQPTAESVRILIHVHARC